MQNPTDIGGCAVQALLCDNLDRAALKVFGAAMMLARRGKAITLADLAWHADMTREPTIAAADKLEAEGFLRPINGSIGAYTIGNELASYEREAAA